MTEEEMIVALLSSNISGPRIREALRGALEEFVDGEGGAGGGGGSPLWEIQTLNLSSDKTLVCATTKTLVEVTGIDSIGAAYSALYLPETGLTVGQEIIIKMMDTVGVSKSFLIVGSNPPNVEVDNSSVMQDVLHTIRDTIHIVWNGTRWHVIAKRVFADE